MRFSIPGFGEKIPKVLTVEDAKAKLSDFGLMSRVVGFEGSHRMGGFDKQRSDEYEAFIPEVQKYLKDKGYDVEGGVKALIDTMVFGIATSNVRAEELAQWEGIEDTLKAQSEMQVTAEAAPAVDVAARLKEIAEKGQIQKDTSVIDRVGDTLHANARAEKEAAEDAALIDRIINT